MGGVDVVVHRVTLVGRILHGVRRRALFREVDNGVGALSLEQLNQARVIVGDIQLAKSDALAADFLPGVDALFDAGDGGQRLGAQFLVDGAAGKIVGDDYFMACIGQVQGCWPATETVAAENDNLHFEKSLQ